ncbi:PREDICTED: uncharacterized protein LOC104996459, partial [Bison bison bison]|uniref:Epidermal growth factor-like protein 7 n=1 Tax=Bison bison bison TaxID=43346 RepID=A0A6P3IB22_BISBB
SHLISPDSHQRIHQDHLVPLLTPQPGNSLKTVLRPQVQTLRAAGVWQQTRGEASGVKPGGSRVLADRRNGFITSWSTDPGLEGTELGNSYADLSPCPSQDPQEGLSQPDPPRGLPGRHLISGEDTEVTSHGRLGTSAPELGSACPPRHSQQHQRPILVHPPRHPPGMQRRAPCWGPWVLSYARHPWESLATDAGVGGTGPFENLVDAVGCCAPPPERAQAQLSTVTAFRGPQIAPAGLPRPCPEKRGKWGQAVVAALQGGRDSPPEPCALSAAPTGPRVLLTTLLPEGLGEPGAQCSRMRVGSPVGLGQPGLQAKLGPGTCLGRGLRAEDLRLPGGTQSPPPGHSQHREPHLANSSRDKHFLAAPGSLERESELPSSPAGDGSLDQAHESLDEGSAASGGSLADRAILSPRPGATAGAPLQPPQMPVRASAGGSVRLLLSLPRPEAWHRGLLGGSQKAREALAPRHTPGLTGALWEADPAVVVCSPTLERRHGGQAGGLLEDGVVLARPRWSRLDWNTDPPSMQALPVPNLLGAGRDLSPSPASASEAPGPETGGCRGVEATGRAGLAAMRGPVGAASRAELGGGERAVRADRQDPLPPAPSKGSPLPQVSAPGSSGHRYLHTHTLRTLYRTAYRRRPRLDPTRPRYACCPGWKRTGGVPGACGAAICQPPCQNGGSCVQPGRCHCPAGWQGNACQTDVDECSTGEGGCPQRCVNTAGSYWCQCWEGHRPSVDRAVCLPERGAPRVTPDPTTAGDRAPLLVTGHYYFWYAL